MQREKFCFVLAQLKKTEAIYRLLMSEELSWRESAALVMRPRWSQTNGEFRVRHGGE